MERWITLKNGYRLWSKTVGRGKGTPLLTLHGGPGAGHDYLETLEQLGEDRPVIFYDQLGCGRSEKPSVRGLWLIERFADEIDEVRLALGLERIHLLGQSWGGWLGIEYLLRQPPGISSAVLASTSCSLPQFSAECARLISELPAQDCDALNNLGAKGAYDDPAYQAAAMKFYRRHVCRLDPWPDCFERTVRNLDRNAVYETINGPNEFTVIGNLRYWDRTRDLHAIALPVLLTCGAFDELGPNCSRTILQNVPNARLEIFANSSHTAHLEERDAYMAVVGEFLRSHDGAS